MMNNRLTGHKLCGCPYKLMFMFMLFGALEQCKKMLSFNSFSIQTLRNLCWLLSESV